MTARCNNKHWGKTFLALGGFLLLGGCITYQQRPIDPVASARAYETRSLNDPMLAELLSKLLSAEQSTRVNDGVWDRTALLVAAIRFNPALAEARAQLKESVAASEASKALPNVTIGLSSEYDLTRTAESPWLWAISTDFLLDAVFQKHLRSQLADEKVRQARLVYAEALWSIRKELCASLLSVAIVNKRVDVLTEIDGARAQLTTLVRQRYELGEASATELLQAQIESTRAHTELIRARSEQVVARSRLATAVGLPIAVLDAVQVQESNLENLAVPDEARLVELRQRALLSRADIEQAIAVYQSREVELQQQVRAQYPQLSVGPGYMWDHGIRKATLGLSLSLPLFGGNRGPIAEADARRESAGEHLLAIQAAAMNEIDAAYRAYLIAVEALVAVREEAVAAVSLADRVNRAVGLGAEDRMMLLTTQVAANTEKLALIEAVDRAQLALGQWEDALRTPLVGTEIDLQSAIATNSHESKP